MTQIRTSIERVRRWVRNTGQTRQGVSLAAGLHRHTLRPMFDDDWNPTAHTLEAVERLIPDDFNEHDGQEDAA